jgi:hypothetical protein
MQTIDRSKIAKELNAFCDKFDTYSAAARKLGITLAQLSTARNDESTVIPAKALDKLGYGYTLVYVRKADMPAKVKTRKPVVRKPVKTKSKAETAAKRAPAKPAEKAAEKPAAAPVSAPRPKIERPTRPKVDVTVQAPPAQRDVPSTTPPAKVVEIAGGDGAAFN